MTDSYMKDIIYDLIESKLKIKDMEYKMLKLISENEELTRVNNDIKDEVNKWKTQVVSYMNDYRDMYNKSSVDECKQEAINEIVVENVNDDNKSIDNTDNTSENAKKPRSEYMKEYMRNKRKQKKEELKQITVNKK